MSNLLQKLCGQQLFSNRQNNRFDSNLVFCLFFNLILINSEKYKVKLKIIQICVSSFSFAPLLLLSSAPLSLGVGRAPWSGLRPRRGPVTVALGSVVFLRDKISYACGWEEAPPQGGGSRNAVVVPRGWCLAPIHAQRMHAIVRPISAPSAICRLHTHGY